MRCYHTRTFIDPLAAPPAIMAPPTTIKFGTDGWRALIARDFTFANVRACAEGVGRLLLEEGTAERGLVVGYDTRFGSPEFAAEVARVTTAQGIPTYLCDRVTPTPVVSYNIVHRHAAGGVVITASHNPAAWNGFKYKPSYGGSASPETIARLEAHIAAAATAAGDTPPAAPSPRAGALEEFDPAPPYLENVAKTLDLSAIQGAGLRVAVDSMHGAGAGYLRRLLEGGRTSVTELRGEHNPLFPGMAQPEPIAPNLHGTIAAVRDGGFDVALATDGDADRLGVLDEQGEFLTTLQTFSLLCMHLLEVRGERGPLVKSLTQSGMVDKLGELYGVPVHTTPVGFKHLGPAMMGHDALAAGEESGGYAFRGNVPERDGLFSALLFLELMVRTSRRPSELVRWLSEKVGPHAYDRWDLPLDSGKGPSPQKLLAGAPPERLGGLRVQSRDSMDGVRYVLEQGYWGLVRFSGTEPLVRLYAEAESPDGVRAVLGDLRTLAGL